MDGGADSNADELMRQLQDQLAGFQKNLGNQVFSALTLLEAEILSQLRGKSGLHVRTGALLNSISRSKKVTLNSDGSVTGEIGPEGIPYAAIQEFGGTIVPKSKQFLAIPTEENRRDDGLPIMTTTELKATGNSFIRNSMIFLAEGKKITPMFLLRRSVTIPARPYLSTALANTQDQILKDFGVFIQAAFEGGS